MSFYDSICSLHGDDLYTFAIQSLEDLCLTCEQNTKSDLVYSDNSCSFLVADQSCPTCACVNPNNGSQVWTEGSCPSNNTCTTEDYRMFTDHIKGSRCTGHAAGTHHYTWVFCQVAPEFNQIPSASWVPKQLPIYRTPSMEVAIAVESDECKVHADCADGQYCVNGQLAFTPAASMHREEEEYFVEANPARNVCRDYHLCCKNIDAVGPNGEINDLYSCPDEAQCTSWASKAYQCYLTDANYAYCPSLGAGKKDYCIDLSTQSCRKDCDPLSSLSGYAVAKEGVRMCVRESDHDGKGNYYSEVTDAPAGLPQPTGSRLTGSAPGLSFLSTVSLVLSLHNLL